MQAKPRGRGSSSRVLSTIRKLNNRGRSLRPSRPTTSKLRPAPSTRRSRSPRPIKKSVLPRATTRRNLSFSPKRTVSRNSRDVLEISKKTGGSSNTRTRSPDKGHHSKPTYEGAGKKISYSKEDLKKITKNISRDFPEENTQIIRHIVRPEEVTIIRRPGEGATPIFDRQEIIENKRNYDDYNMEPRSSGQLHCEPSTSYTTLRARDNNERERDRSIISRRSPQRDDLRFHSSKGAERSRSFDRSREYHLERKDRLEDREDFRNRRRSLERDRNIRRSLDRDVIPRRRSLERKVPRRSVERMRDSRRSLERIRDTRRSVERRRSLERMRRSLERVREPMRSFERTRPTRRSPERSREPRRSPDRMREIGRSREMRRSPERNRGRSDDRLTRRGQSPTESRRRNDYYRSYEDRRSRSLEREEDLHHRDHRNYGTSDSKFSGSDSKLGKSRSGHYEEDGGYESSSSRGRGRGFQPRGRGGAVFGIPYHGIRGYFPRPLPPVWPVRGVPIVRGPYLPRSVILPPRFPGFRYSAPVRPPRIEFQ